MIESITVTNHIGETIEMPLTNPEISGFVVTSITGLNPPKADINTTELVVSDGSVYNSSRLQERNIVITLVFLPKSTIEECRQLTYKYFPIKKKVRLTIKTERRRCYIDGYVESNEAEIFSRQTATQISIICPSPYLYDLEDQSTIFSGTLDNFEFMIAPEYDAIGGIYQIGDYVTYNNILYQCVVAVTTPEEFTSYKWTVVDIEDGMPEGTIEFPLYNPIEFSVVVKDTTKAVVYAGEMDTGVTIVMQFLDAVSNIRIWNYYTGEEIDIDTTKVAAVCGGAIQNEDIITITTYKGGKGIYLTRDGVEYNILNCINRDANWFQLKQGPNTFVYYAETGIDNILFSISNSVLYQGI